MDFSTGYTATHFVIRVFIDMGKVIVRAKFKNGLQRDK